MATLFISISTSYIYIEMRRDKRHSDCFGFDGSMVSMIRFGRDFDVPVFTIRRTANKTYIHTYIHTYSVCLVSPRERGGPVVEKGGAVLSLFSYAPTQTTADNRMVGVCVCLFCFVSTRFLRNSSRSSSSSVDFQPKHLSYF